MRYILYQGYRWKLLPIYSKKEADALGIEYIDWYKAGVGFKGWGVTDDGWVVRIKNVSLLTTNNGQYQVCIINTDIGKTFYYYKGADRKGNFSAEMRLMKYSSNKSLTFKTKYSLMVKGSRNKNFVDVLAGFLAENKSATMKSTVMALTGYIKENSQYYSIIKGYFMNDEGVVQAVKKSVSQLLEESGADPKWIIDTRKRLIDKAIDSGNFGEANRALDKFDKMAGLDVLVSSGQNTVEFTKTTNLHDRIEEEKVKMTKTIITKETEDE